MVGAEPALTCWNGCCVESCPGWSHAVRGISEAEIIRQGIHLAAMANRVWDEPLFSRTFPGPGRTLTKGELRDVVADAAQRETGSGTAA
ncbi:hypothetical protein SVIO_058670 [Streptomyces violaceusniger]|uniref:Uncharacterized protein n=1 Tax=Streptomyces violaceusniger TaxID=68280 RepID=A0A4D4L4B1_STRVO|nr:hypothetical protein SVIO_058670 [Streptomyces violaceusniger]